MPIAIALRLYLPKDWAQDKGEYYSGSDNNYCYLPLYVFCGQDLLACVLRPSSRDPASVLSALIKLLVRRLRQDWPATRIIVRADSGFCRPAALRRFEKWDVHYIIGLPQNAVLLRQVELAELALADAHEATGTKQRMIGHFEYAARSWDRERHVIARLEHDARGANPRFVATSLHGDWDALYEQLYCVGAAVVRNTRRVRVLLASQHPLKNVFFGAARALAP